MTMTNSDKARVHAKRAYVCSVCRKVVHGNGGRSSHARMHVRRGEAEAGRTTSAPAIS